MNEVGNYDPKPNEIKRFTQWAIDCFLDLNIMQPHSTKIAYLTVNEGLNAELPSDYVRYCKIGVNVGGRFKTLTYDSAMIPSTEYTEGSIVSVKKDVKGPHADSLFFNDHYASGQFVGGFYTQPGGYNDTYYKVDRERGVISLSNQLDCRELILEYISTGINTQSDIIVPIEAVPVIVAYMHMVWSKNTGDVPMNKQIQRDQDYNDAYNKLLTLRTIFTADEYLDMVYSTYHQGIKR
jgi:hypothetical protein